MRRRPNPYRVLAHALDVGDARLVELLQARLIGQVGSVAAAGAPGAPPPSASAPSPLAPGAEAAVERLLSLLDPRGR